MSTYEKSKNTRNKAKKKNETNSNIKIGKLTPFIIKEKVEIIKTVEDEEEEKKENITKLKLYAALNNINDEINVKIDSKDRFKNTALNLDSFINRPASRKNKTAENNLYTNSDENSLEKTGSKKSLKNNDNNNILINQKEDYLNNYINKENKNNIEPNDIYNNTNKRNRNSPEYNDKNKNNENLKKIISLSLNKEELKLPIFKTDDDNKKKKDKFGESNLKTDPHFNYINNKNDNKNINNADKIPKPEYLENKKNEDFRNLSNTKNNNKTLNKKLTLYNLDNDDKLLLKNMEKNFAFIITDISFLNKKKISNYNISLNSFDIQKILNYYIYLVQENKKEQIAVINLKNNITELKDEFVNINKDNKLENNKNPENENNKLKEIRNYNNYNKIGNSDILTRYQQDLNYFEDLINNMNKEIKDI